VAGFSLFCIDIKIIEISP